jgi:hypothetical protein
MDYLIAIPSYDRVDVLRNKTIALLESNDIPKESVYIFVAPNDQQKYTDAFPGYNIVVADCKGILQTRNFITRYFPEGQKLVHFDDDIESVLEKVTDDKTDGTMVPVNLKEFIATGFADIESRGLSMFGINPVANPFFMSRKISTDLRYVVAAFRGVINHHDIVLSYSDQKEDVENTIRAYIRDGGVLRYNYITVKTKWYAPGGIVSQSANGSIKARKELSKAAVDMLVAAFPAYGTCKQRKSGIYEFVLKRNPKCLQ